MWIQLAKSRTASRRAQFRLRKGLRAVFCRAILVTSFLLGPVIAHADDISPLLPALYQTTNVATDDILNVREMPDAGSLQIGSLPYNATDIEVVGFSFQGNWAMINIEGQTGWVSARFLKPAPDETYNSRSLQCFGTEPFWSLSITQNEILISTPDAQTRHPIQTTSPASEIVDFRAFGGRVTWNQEQNVVRSFIMPGRCNDGMSDAIYGLHYIDDRGAVGCCSLQ